MPQIRIIAGKWRGRKLPVLDAPDLRPTPDRVREDLFNWLQTDIRSARCLELFAGTGALSFEALSRGAASATMLELNPLCFKVLAENIARLDCADQVQLLNQDANAWLKQQHEPFDIIFLDPPFKQQWSDKIFAQLLAAGLITTQTLIYFEAAAELKLAEPFTILKAKRAGAVYYHLISYQQ